MITIQFMKVFVRVAGIYNASAVLVFLTPGVLPFLGVTLPHSRFGYGCPLSWASLQASCSCSPRKTW